MGIITRLTVALALALPALAEAACEPGAEGLVVAEADGRLRVAAAAPNSAAALAGIVVGDAILQVNGARPATCEAWRAALEAARRDGMALLVLAQHGLQRRVFAVAARATTVAAARASSADADQARGRRAAPPPAPARSRTTTTTSRPVDLLPGAVPVTRADVIVLIEELGLDGRARFDAYRDAVGEARRALSTLLVRDPGTADADTLLAIVRRHEGAVVAWEAVESIRRRQGLRSSVPVSVGATESFFVGSQVASLVDEMPSLARAVRLAPSEGRIEMAGRWEPMRARTLLWDEADALVAELVGDRQRD